MTESEKKVIEAAGGVRDRWLCTAHDGSLNVEIEALDNTLREYEAQDAESDYKWLAMDGDMKIWLYHSKPIYQKSNGVFAVDQDAAGEAIACPEHPSFVNKPGQLWERRVTELDFARLETDGYKKWNGYWWRLAEDNRNSVQKLYDEGCELEKKIEEAEHNAGISNGSGNECDNGDDTGTSSEGDGMEMKFKKGDMISHDGKRYTFVEYDEIGWVKACLVSTEFILRTEACNLLEPVEQPVEYEKHIEQQGWIPVEEWDYMNWPVSATFAATMKKGRSFWPGLAVIRHEKLIPVNQYLGEIVAFKPFGDLYTKPEEPKSCEGCKHYATWESTVGACCLIKTFEPNCGQEGCDYAPKEKGE